MQSLFAQLCLQAYHIQLQVIAEKYDVIFNQSPRGIFSKLLCTSTNNIYYQASATFSEILRYECLKPSDWSSLLSRNRSVDYSCNSKFPAVNNNENKRTQKQRIKLTNVILQVMYQPKTDEEDSESESYNNFNQPILKNECHQFCSLKIIQIVPFSASQWTLKRLPWVHWSKLNIE